MSVRKEGNEGREGSFGGRRGKKEIIGGKGSRNWRVRMEGWVGGRMGVRRVRIGGKE